MTKNTKIFLGVLSFVPLVTLIAYFVFFVRIFLNMLQDSHSLSSVDNPESFFLSFIPLIILLGIGSLVGLFLLVYFIYCSIKDVSATENNKLLWVLLLIFLNYLSFPIYWFIRIWKNPNFSTQEQGLDQYDN